MLFNWDLLLPDVHPGDRDAWKSMHTSFDYDQMLASAPTSPQPTMARVAGYALRQVDQFVNQLGNPIGLASYKPYQSTGEDFLYDYLGMAGIPVDLYPTFPTDAHTVLLTESAKFDPQIVSKIKVQLQAGKNVVITSGLLHALQGKGIEDIVELRYTDHKIPVNEYAAGLGPATSWAKSDPVLIPEIRFLTNDAWPLVRGLENGNGYPLLILDRYSKGTIFVLTIPENFANLYQLPPQVLSAIKDSILGDLPVRMDGASKVSLFVYDNNTFIVESFLDQETNITVSNTANLAKLKNLVTGEELNGVAAPIRRWPREGNAVKRINFPLTLKPHSYLVFAEEK
jgi:hypothetical protein